MKSIKSELSCPSLLICFYSRISESISSNYYVSCDHTLALKLLEARGILTSEFTAWFDGLCTTAMNDDVVLSIGQDARLSFACAWQLTRPWGACRPVSFSKDS